MKRHVTLVVLLLLALTGCASEKTRGLKLAHGGSSPSPSSSPSASPSPKPTGTPTAADGSKVDACADGTCEIAVTAGLTVPVSREFGVGSLLIRAVGANDVTVGVTLLDGGSLGCDLDPQCQVSVVGGAGDGPATGDFVVHPGARVTANRLVIDVVAIGAGVAVLRFSRG